MSYSGYYEFLCEKGHYERVGCWDDDPKACFFCKSPIKYRHSVDTTNGQNPDEPWSMPAPKKLIGHDDRWFEDHYGNRYAKQIERYAPGGGWQVGRKPAALGE